MSKYRIKITYGTGDSFKSESGLEAFLDGSWESEYIATENAVRISEHYKYYQSLNSYKFGFKAKKEAQELQKAAKKQAWFVDDEFSEYSVNLVTDDRVEYQQSAFWCGYFESLEEVEVTNELYKNNFRR